MKRTINFTNNDIAIVFEKMENLGIYYQIELVVKIMLFIK